MSKLTLDEAIKHCLEVAESNYELADKFDAWDEWEKADADNCRDCAADHRQLAEWLMELKDLRAEQNDQYVFIHELMSELKEAKRLLKLAIEDFSGMDNHIYSCDRLCDNCPLSGERDHCLKWQYTDEVKKLINDEK